MTVTLTVLAFLVGGAAAARSTWSPCGLSMLSTITPFAERGKGHRYRVTCTWFILGATLGGLALGAFIAGLAALTRSVGPTPTAMGTVGLVATLVVLVSDTGLAGRRLPVHYRQVNERWLDAYRPWVYGTGFGFQIGTGVATYISTAAIYLTVALGGLTASPAVALVLGATFGLARGMAVTLTRRVTTPARLVAFHIRFDALGRWADRGVLAMAAMAAVVLAAATGAGPSLVATASVASMVVVVRVVQRVVGARRTPMMDPEDPVGSVRSVGESDRSVAVV